MAVIAASETVGPCGRIRSDGTAGTGSNRLYAVVRKTVVPVTGGSITCNMNDVLNSIRISSDTRQIDSCIVPRTIEIPGVAVAGEE